MFLKKQSGQGWLERLLTGGSAEENFKSHQEAVVRELRAVQAEVLMDAAANVVGGCSKQTKLDPGLKPTRPGFKSST